MTTPRVHHCLRCSSSEFDLVIDKRFYAAVCRQCLLTAMTYPLDAPAIPSRPDKRQMNIIEKRHFLNHSILVWFKPNPDATNQDIEDLFELHEFCRKKKINICSVDLYQLKIHRDSKVIAEGIML